MTDLRSLPGGKVQPPEHHLSNVLREAEALFNNGQFTKGLASMSHAVFIAATTGKESLSETELLHQLRGISNFGTNPDGEAA